MTVKQNTKNIIAIIYMTVLSVIAFAYGLTIIPSPIVVITLSLDHKRVVDLGELQTAVDSYYRDNGILPRQLSQLTTNTDPNSPLDRTDPQTKQSYEYYQVDAITYKLCATFTTSSLKEDQSETDYDITNPDYTLYSNQFKHPTGHFCFQKNELNNSVITKPLVVPRNIDTSSPSALLNSFYKSGTCEWTPTFSLTGFAPYSAIHTNAHLNLSD